MLLQTQHAIADVRTVAGATSARLTVTSFDDANAQAVGDELLRLADTAGAAELRLDLCALEYLSSAGLGKLLVLYKRLRAAGGRLSFCKVRPVVYEVFEVTRLTGLFDVCPAGDESRACACRGPTPATIRNVGR